MHNAHVQDVTTIMSNLDKEDGVSSQKVKDYTLLKLCV
jgi:hypothetical protein